MGYQFINSIKNNLPKCKFSPPKKRVNCKRRPRIPKPWKCSLERRLLPVVHFSPPWNSTQHLIYLFIHSFIYLFISFQLHFCWALTPWSNSRSHKPEFTDATASKTHWIVLWHTMHSRNSQNRISGSASRPPISPLFLALLATMAAVYVAGRWV